MNRVRKESCAHRWLHEARWQDGRLKQVLEVTLILLLHTFHKRLNAGLSHALSQTVPTAVWMKDTLHRFKWPPLVPSWWAAWEGWGTLRSMEPYWRKWVTGWFWCFLTVAPLPAYSASTTANTMQMGVVYLPWWNGIPLHCKSRNKTKQAALSSFKWLFVLWFLTAIRQGTNTYQTERHFKGESNKMCLRYACCKQWWQERKFETPE